jgi:hypothetical protein
MTRGFVKSIRPALAFTLPFSLALTLAPAFAQDRAAGDPVASLVGQLDLQRYKATIKELTRFGDRQQGTERNRKAIDWIEAQLQSYGCATERIRYDFKPVPRTRIAPTGGGRAGPSGQGGSTLFGTRGPIGVNTDPQLQPNAALRALNAEQPDPKGGPREEVVCTKVGTSRPDEMYIVAAHMDGLGHGEAANDDASGTALVMELARILSAPGVSTERTIRFALWPERRHCLRRAAQGLAGHRIAEGFGPLSGAALAGHDPARHDDVRPRHAVAETGRRRQAAAGRQGPAAGGAGSKAAARSRRQYRIPEHGEAGRRRAKAGLAFPRRQRKIRLALSGGGGPAHDEYRFDAFHGLGAFDFAARERARHADRRRQPTDLFANYTDDDFLLGLNAAQTTLAAVAQLAGAKVAAAAK